VGVGDREQEDVEDFHEPLETLNDELEQLNLEARELEGRIADTV